MISGSSKRQRLCKRALIMRSTASADESSLAATPMLSTYVDNRTSCPCGPYERAQQVSATCSCTSRTGTRPRAPAVQDPVNDPLARCPTPTTKVPTAHTLRDTTGDVPLPLQAAQDTHVRPSNERTPQDRDDRSTACRMSVCRMAPRENRPRTFRPQAELRGWLVGRLRRALRTPCSHLVVGQAFQAKAEYAPR